jgi:kynureninase
MNHNPTDISTALDMDGQDELASFREAFVIDDPNLIYLDGNSLGRLPKHTAELLQTTIRHEWGNRLIRSWNEGWIDHARTLGAKIAHLVGAREDEIIVGDSTSINLFKLAAAAVRFNTDRTEIVSDVFNFPSDLYILQGIIDLLGSRHNLKMIPSADSIAISPDDVAAAIDTQTALVCLTHVAFKSAFMYDMATVTELAHRSGALMLWDLSHSTGAVPLDLNASDADIAVGCTYKYLNGGPGSPAFLYVRRDLQEQLLQPMWGWFAARQPFAFGLEFEPSADITRFQVGTPTMLSLKAVEAGLDLTLEAGMGRIRAKSIRQTDYLITLAEAWLAPLGFIIGSPLDASRRGSHVSLRHPEAYRINRALIESPSPAVQVIPDFREPDNIRLGITPLYTTFQEIYLAMDRLRTIASEKLYEQFSCKRSKVT